MNTYTHEEINITVTVAENETNSLGSEAWFMEVTHLMTHFVTHFVTHYLTVESVMNLFQIEILETGLRYGPGEFVANLMFQGVHNEDIADFTGIIKVQHPPQRMELTHFLVLCQV